MICDIDEEGRDGVWRCTLGIGIMDLLGGLGGCVTGGEELLNPDADVGEVGDCDCEFKAPSSSSQPPTDRTPEIERKVLAGVGIWLGVLGRVRGVVARPGVIAREGV